MGCCGVSANEYSCTHGAQINFGDLTPYLTYGGIAVISQSISLFVLPLPVSSRLSTVFYNSLEIIDKLRNLYKWIFLTYRSFLNNIP